MRVILNADDFGFDADTVRATIECFEQGGLTSATIMANMDATAEALAYAKENPQFSFGAHLTFSSDGPERPVLPPSSIPGLVDETGRFLDPVQVRTRALRNVLPVDEIAREMEAQLGVLVDHGIALSHVDSHGHLHKFKPFRAAMAIILPKFGITRVRNVQNIYLRAPLRSPTYWLSGFWRRRIMSLFATTPHFFMPTSAGDKKWIRPLLQRTFDGALEVGVHPGYAEPWRDQERAACIRFGAAARDAGWKAVCWNRVKVASPR
ncbi:MAG TPA: ChbG/HpnK family deacetylase [Phycisphaerales bacterium]|nr:ChbG/HpnK family deacetylase [Phycisphaerales bacterium]HRQ75843.1 ChbG/HpnK family deacetylase [Phycisphaerales bacterium]